MKKDTISRLPLTLSTNNSDAQKPKARAFKMPEHLSRESRTIGALLGLHAGDSLGAGVEFESHAEIAAKYPAGPREIVGGGIFNWPAGHATDDTDMTRGVLLAYRTCKPGLDVAAWAGRHFLKWLYGDWPARKHGSSPKDIGNATRTGLTLFAKTGNPDKAGSGNGSAGNGSLMRCLPTGLFQSDASKLISESMRISAITHEDARCTISCAVYNWIVAHLLRGTSPREAVEAGEALAKKLEDERGKEHPVYDAVQLGKVICLSEVARYGPPKGIMKGGCSGYVLETLTLAVAAVLDKRSFEDALVDVVRVGRDTDTNAAVAGGLLGARDGEEAIPWRWRNKLQFAGEFREVAVEMVQRNSKYKSHKSS